MCQTKECRREFLKSVIRVAIRSQSFVFELSNFLLNWSCVKMISSPGGCELIMFTSHLSITCFIPLKACSKRFLPIYYTVIAWNKTDIFKHLFPRKYFITLQLWSLFFALKYFRNAVFKCMKLNPFQNSVQLCCKPDVLIFCASTCVGNLVCVIKHFIVIFLEMIYSSLLC